MKKISAGILVYRISNGIMEILLGHPGGPFWSKKDLGVWSIPKGGVNENENYLSASKREFSEETGFDIPENNITEIGSIIQKSGKIVYAWAYEANFDTSKFKSNTFELEWPPKSGKTITAPEIDKLEYFDVKTAKEKINPAQIEFIDRLQKKLDNSFAG